MNEPVVANQLALGEHYLTVKMPEKGIEQLRTLLALEPDHERARLLLARCLNNLQRREEARREVDLVLRANPSSADAHYMASFLGGSHAESLASIDRALALLPGASYLHSQRASILLRGSSRLWGLVKKRELIKQAEAATRHALQLNSQDWLAHRLLALALLSQNRAEEARQHVMTTLSLNPENPRSYLLLSLLSNQQNDSKGAEAALREALRLDPTNRNLQRDVEIQQWLSLPIFNAFGNLSQPYLAQDNPTGPAAKIYNGTVGRLPELWRLPALVGAQLVTLGALVTIPSQWMKPGDFQLAVTLGLLVLFCFFLFNTNYAARPWLARIPVKYLPADLKKWGKAELPSDLS